MKPKILIVDDEKPTRDLMARILGAKYTCLTAPDTELALREVAAHPDLSLLVTDYKMPGGNGIDLIKQVKKANPALGAILITAFGEIELAVEAMKHGADDFLTKPVTDITQLELRIAQAIKTVSLKREVASLKSQIGTELENFTGKSPVMENVYRLIRKVAPTEATVLIEGPSGSGKELAARAVHNLSNRAAGPFVAVECAALSSTLLESELFGHEKGAFTDAHTRRIGKFELASGGTLFLDEIGDIDAQTQVKLLRVLESHTFQRVGGNENIAADFRLVTATNRDLAARVAAGDFREDLYYRLNVIDIRMPALKDHPEDIAPLVARFLEEFGAKNGGRMLTIDPAALKTLESYTWPGNVRQLRNTIEKTVILASGDRITVEDLPIELTMTSAPSIRGDFAAPDAGTTLEETERRQILAALEACRNNKSKAADMLGISRRTLHRKLKDWGRTK